jgi:branched-subunit amino acid transport protein
MSWWTVIALAAGAYVFKTVGLVALGGRPLPPHVQSCLNLIPPALLAALIVTTTFGDGQRLVLDARVPGVAAAAAAAWRGWPFPVVIVLGAAVTALVRAVA